VFWATKPTESGIKKDRKPNYLCVIDSNDRARNFQTHGNDIFVRLSKYAINTPPDLVVSRSGMEIEVTPSSVRLSPFNSGPIYPELNEPRDSTPGNSKGPEKL